MNYSIWKGVQKGLIQAIVFGLPILLQATPDAWKNITIGAALSMIVNYIKVRWAASEPVTA